MIAETQLMSSFSQAYKNKIQAVVLLVENSNLSLADKPYYESICGRQMFEYVMGACSGFNTKIAVLNEGENPISSAKQVLTDEEITLILFSDTPLLTVDVLNDYISKLLLDRGDVVIMPRGFVFKTKKLLQTTKIDLPPKSLFDKSEFFTVSNLLDLENATRHIQNQIINRHIQNGVFIADRQLVKIDANVEIEKGVKILPFSQILGRSFIEKNSVISSSIIKNSKVEQNCFVENCNIENSKLIKGSKPKPFSVLRNEEYKEA